jgi:hypothetical protein
MVRLLRCNIASMGQHQVEETDGRQGYRPLARKPLVQRTVVDPERGSSLPVEQV